MHILRVSLGVSALAVAVTVVYGYLFGLQSARYVNLPSIGFSDFFYYFVIAVAAGTLAAILGVRRELRARTTVESTTALGVAYGIFMGVVTGGLLVVWQLLFAAVVNVLMGQPGLYIIPSSSPHTTTTNSQVLLIGYVIDILFTFIYSLFQGFAAVIAGILAGGITGFLYENAHARHRTEVLGDQLIRPDWETTRQ